MSKVFIAGGSGRVATDLIKDLVAAGNTVVTGARRPKKSLSWLGSPRSPWISIAMSPRLQP